MSYRKVKTRDNSETQNFTETKVHSVAVVGTPTHHLNDDDVVSKTEKYRRSSYFVEHKRVEKIEKVSDKCRKYECGDTSSFVPKKMGGTSLLLSLGVSPIHYPISDVVGG